jgi:TPR repeat protein
VARDEKRSVDLASVSCLNSVAEGCNLLGLAYLQGVGRPRDTERAVHFGAACDGHAPWGCYYLGMLRLLGDGVAKDARGAAEDFRRGCAMASPIGRVQCCASLGMMFFAGVVDDVSESDARKWLRQGCDEKVEQYCAALEHLGEPR